VLFFGGKVAAYCKAQADAHNWLEKESQDAELAQ
jgi:hypothetical protein